MCTFSLIVDTIDITYDIIVNNGCLLYNNKESNKNIYWKQIKENLIHMYKVTVLKGYIESDSCLSHRCQII